MSKISSMLKMTYSLIIAWLRTVWYACDISTLRVRVRVRVRVSVRVRVRVRVRVSLTLTQP